MILRFSVFPLLLGFAFGLLFSRTDATALNLIGDAAGDNVFNQTDTIALLSQRVGQASPATISPLGDVDGNGAIGLGDGLWIGQAVAGYRDLNVSASRVLLTPPAPVSLTSGDPQTPVTWTVVSSVSGADYLDHLQTSLTILPADTESTVSDANPPVSAGLASPLLTPQNTTGATENLTLRLELAIHDQEALAVVDLVSGDVTVDVAPSVCGNAWVQPGEACDDGELDECTGACNGDCSGPAYLNCGLCPLGETRVGGVCQTAGAIFHYNDDTENPENPFPDDRLVDLSGNISLPEWNMLQLSDPTPYLGTTLHGAIIDLIALIGQYADGFGTYSPLEVSLSQAIDEATLSAGVYTVNLDSMTLWTEGWTGDWQGYINRLDLHPGMPLDSVTRYGVIFTSAVQTPGGLPLGYDRDFRNLLGGNPGGDLGALITYATGTLGLARDEIAGAFTFTTAPTWQDLWQIRDRLDSGDLAAPIPTFTNLGSTPYTEGIFGNGATKNSLMGTASPNYQTAAVGTTYLYNFRGADLTFDPALIAPGSTPPTDPVNFNLAIPNVTMPAGGYPIVVLGHGLGGSADFAWEVARYADDYTPMPDYALIAHDHPHHGYRGTGDDQIDLLSYFNMANFYAMRDNFRSTAGDIAQMRRMVRNAALNNIPPFDQINPDRIYYLGGSLGGINGATYLAIDSQVTVGVLSVPSAELVKILQSPTFSNELLPYIESGFGITPADPAYDEFFRVLINRGLWIMGPGDPINYAPFIQRAGNQLPGASAKSVLIQLGVGDTLLPNETTRRLAEVIGVPTIASELQCGTPGCGVSGMWEFTPADYGFAGEEPHNISRYIPEAQEQIIRYLQYDGSWITNAAP